MSVEKPDRRDARAPSSGELIGHEIGLTSKAMQDVLGVTEPDYGHVNHDRVTEQGGTVDVGQVIAPEVQPEIEVEDTRSSTWLCSRSSRRRSIGAVVIAAGEAGAAGLWDQQHRRRCRPQAVPQPK